jgi:hypothetical protein
MTEPLRGRDLDQFFRLAVALADRPTGSSRWLGHKVGCSHMHAQKIRRIYLAGKEEIDEQLRSAGFRVELGMEAGMPRDRPLQRLVERHQARKNGGKAVGLAGSSCKDGLSATADALDVSQSTIRDDVRELVGATNSDKPKRGRPRKADQPEVRNADLDQLVHDVTQLLRDRLTGTYG